MQQNQTQIKNITKMIIQTFLDKRFFNKNFIRFPEIREFYLSTIKIIENILHFQPTVLNIAIDLLNFFQSIQNLFYN